MSTVLQRPRRHHADGPTSSLVVRNIVVAGHRTSVRLEPAMWDALHDIARRMRVSIHDLVTEIAGRRTESSLTAAIRVHIVDFYRAAALRADQPQAPRPRLQV